MIYMDGYDEDVKLVKPDRPASGRCPVCGAKEICGKSGLATITWHTGSWTRAKVLASYAYKCGSIMVIPDVNYAYVKQSARCSIEETSNTMEDVI